MSIYISVTFIRYLTLGTVNRGFYNCFRESHKGKNIIFCLVYLENIFCDHLLQFNTISCGVMSLACQCGSNVRYEPVPRVISYCVARKEQFFMRMQGILCFSFIDFLYSFVDSIWNSVSVKTNIIKTLGNCWQLMLAINGQYCYITYATQGPIAVIACRQMLATDTTRVLPHVATD